MRKALVGFIGVFAITSVGISHAAEQYQAFPLNQEINTMAYNANDLEVQTSCVVNKSDGEEAYSYTITLDYKTTEKMLLSWNFLNWILNQYPNAIKTRSPSSHLFPLNVGEGNYTFRFESKEAPVWYEHTLIKVFNTSTTVEYTELLKEYSEEYSGVTVSSYDFLSQISGVGASSCLPKNLLVFPQSVRPGF